MLVEELSNYGIEDKFISKFKSHDIESLYPPQEKAIESGLLDNENMILSVPTAAGKTFVATLASIKKLSKDGRKVVYIVPLVALANEKYDYYRKFFKGCWDVGKSVGNLDSSSSYLSRYDFIVCTTEKLDSLIRHNAGWVHDIDLVILDEIHLLNDPSRGPTLEILITQLRELIPSAQILGLSATIQNSEELSDWLGAKLVKSDFRPVDLYEGVTCSNKIKFLNKDDYELKNTDEESILSNTLDMGKQAIFFLSSRRNAESLARRMTEVTKKHIRGNEIIELEKLSEDILNVLESPTRQCKKISRYVKHGSAFHHAGLLKNQKELIENGFRHGLIKSISATPTLAAGINLPAFRVILRDTKRYYPGFGSNYIPVLEYKQIAGRAGRPQYDEYGESVIFARNENEVDSLIDRFILGEPEDIKSKLSMEPVLRMHVLSLVSNNFARTEDDILDFFSKTFYAYQYGDMSSVEVKIDNILGDLIRWEFVFQDGECIIPTKIGKRVSELYLDPLTAFEFVSAIRKSHPIKPFGILQLISNTSEMGRYVSLRKNEFSELQEVVMEREHMFLQDIPNEWDPGIDGFMKSVKIAMIFESWANEMNEDILLKKYKIAPGGLRSKLYIADWLLYSLKEIMMLTGKSRDLGKIRKIRVRMKYGVNEELLPLVKIKHIGRVRGRKLYNSGVRRVADLRNVGMNQLSNIVGPNIAYKIKKQLGEDVKKPDITGSPAQTNLTKF